MIKQRNSALKQLRRRSICHNPLRWQVLFALLSFARRRQVAKVLAKVLAKKFSRDVCFRRIHVAYCGNEGGVSLDKMMIMIGYVGMVGTWRVLDR